MINEKYTLKTEETSINVVMSDVESIRKKNITKTGFRVYADGKIGVAGVIGTYDEAEMKGKARAALSLGIDYPCEPTGNLKRGETVVCDFEDGVKFTEEIEVTLSELRKSHPDFIFNNKINLSTEDHALENDLGLNLRSRISRIDSSLLLKEKSSPNLLDGVVGFMGTKWDRDEYLRFANIICNGFSNQADVENGIHKVILHPMGCDFMNKLYTELHGLKFGTGGSIFAGKIGEKLFSEDFTLYQSVSSEDNILEFPFFDTEGAVNEKDRYALIENGIFRAPYTDKKTAKQYHLVHTGAAGGEYDSVPTLSPKPLVIRKSEKTIAELLNGETAIYVMFASGGDFTPEGKYATPVQTAFLFDGERFIGRLPQLNLTSNIYDMFGKDYLGTATDSISTLDRTPLTFINMKVEKI